MTDWVTVVLPLASAFVIVQRLARHRSGTKKADGNDMSSGA